MAIVGLCPTKEIIALKAAGSRQGYSLAGHRQDSLARCSQAILSSVVMCFRSGSIP